MKTMPACEMCELLDNIGEDDDTSIVIWCNANVAVLAVDDPAYPGFCRVVWQDHVKEMSELDAAQRAHIMEVVWRVELALRAVMLPEKINLASLGNMTPHVHWHVIPRYLDDAHFPQPIWAAVQRFTPADVLAARRALLPQLHAAIVQGLSA